MPPCNHCRKNKRLKKKKVPHCHGLARLGFGVRYLKMGLHKEEEQRMVRVGMVGVGMEKVQVYRGRREYIYILLQMSDWVIALRVNA
jgi:hypothetical protein